MNDKKLSRREFLIAAGCGCAGLALASSGCSKLAGVTASAALVCPYGYRDDPWPGQCYRYVDSNGSGYCDLSEPAATTGVTGQSATIATPEVTTATGATAGAVICDRHCRYPGQCGRFIDSDGSGFCDLSETVTANAATTVPSTGSAASPATATATPAAQSTTTAGGGTTASTELVILCNRNCSYPGHCGRYTDSNGTGRCDLSEGVPADQAASYSGAGNQDGRGRGRRGG